MVSCAISTRAAEIHQQKNHKEIECHIRRLCPSNFLFFNHFPVMLLRSVESVESLNG